MDAAELARKLGRTFAAGTVLFREGEEGAEMFVIQKGSIRISRSVGDSERTLAILGAGEFVGEMSILIGEKRSATATVLEDAKVVVLDAEMLESLVANNTEVAVRMLKRMAHRLKAANELIEVLLHRDPRVRIVKGLQRLVTERGVEREDGCFIEMSADDLAGQIGLDTPKVTETLARLEMGGMIAGDAQSGYLVRDVARLREFAEFLEVREKFGELDA